MIKKLLCLLIRAYQLTISPLLGPRCRFHPTCSEYAITSLEQHGAIKGLALTIKRLLRCHPYCEGGYDPVPERSHHCPSTHRAQG